MAGIVAGEDAVSANDVDAVDTHGASKYERILYMEWRMAKWAMAGLVAMVLAVSPLGAQLPTMSDVDRGNTAAAAGPLPEWDVAVLKPHAVDDHNMMWQMTADSVILKNLPLEQMICSAWDLKPYQVSGLSGWMNDTGYDLTAKVSSDDVAAYKKLSVTQRREMLQKLLTERFGLKVHNETKTMPVYDLVVDKAGSKLKPTVALDPPSDEEGKEHPEKYKKGSMMMGSGKFEGDGVGTRSLASQLSNVLDKPVLDKTGQTGLYDIKLHYKPDEAAADNGTDPEQASIFVALQEQLGLKLVASKGPVELLVVDAAQRPSEN